MFAPDIFSLALLYLKLYSFYDDKLNIPAIQNRKFTI